MTGSGHEFRDDDLRSRFAALRRDEEAQVPQFALPNPQPGKLAKRRFVKLISVSAGLVTLVAGAFLFFLLSPKPGREPGKPVASLTEWKAPTDFLLETPGRDLLRTVPAIGAWRDYTRPPQPKQKLPQARKQAKP